ncbi:MAG: hypothetical protein ACETWD_00175 [Desulfatiglandales bacterium]
MARRGWNIGKKGRGDKQGHGREDFLLDFLVIYVPPMDGQVRYRNRTRSFAHVCYRFNALAYEFVPLYPTSLMTQA